MSSQLPKIDIYTDGGADPNPGPGGWAAILIHPQRTTELSDGEADTTNNRMELTAAIKALQALKMPCEINFYTDSEYLRKGITEWITGWKRKKWKSVMNVDLWQQLDELVQPHTIHWHWVKGHAGNEWNERADQLASAAIPRKETRIDANAAQVYLRISGAPKNGTGPSGWAAAVVRGDQVEVLSGGHPKISPNHLALYGAIQALRLIPDDEPLQIFTNNSYLLDGITQWVNGWRKGDWQKEIKFKEDWRTLDQMNQNRPLQWVKMTDESAYFQQLKDVVEQAREAAG